MRRLEIYIGFFASILMASAAYAAPVSFTPSGTSTVPSSENLYWDMQSSATATSSLGAVGDIYLSNHGDFHYNSDVSMVVLGATTGGDTLSPGTQVDAASNWGSSGGYTGTYDYNGEMVPPATAYFGLRFQLAGEVHYGWVQIEEGTADHSVLAWGYETTPDTAIAVGAGQTPPVPAATAIPTLPEWALIVMAALMAALGMAHSRRRKSVTN